MSTEFRFDCANALFAAASMEQARDAQKIFSCMTLTPFCKMCDRAH